MLLPRPGSLPVCLAFVAFAALVLGGPGCNDRKCLPNSPCPTPTPLPGTPCRSIAGTQNMYWSDTCGRQGQGQIVIAQAGCGVTANVPSLGTLTGTISGTTMTFQVAFSSPCMGSGNGTTSITANPIIAEYDGSETGGSTCCGTTHGKITFDNSPPAPTPTPTPAH